MSAHHLPQSLASGKRLQAVESFRQRVVWLVFARLLLAWCAGWLMSWGCFILVWRGLHLPDAQAAWGALGVIPAAIGAGAMAARLAPAPGAVLAALDARSGAQGMLLLEAEQGDLGAWAGRLPTLPELPLAWRPGRFAPVALLSALFVVAAFIVPVPAVAEPVKPLDITADIKALNAQVELLKEQGLVDDPVAQAIKEQLNQLQGEAKGENPAKTWEALDHLKNQVQSVAEQAAQEVEKDAKAADMALQAGQALDMAGQELSPEQLSMARLAQQQLEDKAFAQATDGDLRGVKPPAGLQVPADMLAKLNPQQRAQLQEFLKQNRQALGDLARRMAQAGLGQGGRNPKALTPEQAKKLMQALKDKKGQCKDCGKPCKDGKCEGGCPGGDCEGKGGGAGESALDQLLNAMNGAGGFNQHTEGGGPTAGITWKDPTTNEGADFDPKTLEAGLDFENSIKLGESTTAPSADGKAASSSGGGLSGTVEGGGSAARQNVLPRHRQAVDRYFERK